MCGDWKIMTDEYVTADCRRGGPQQRFVAAIVYGLLLLTFGISQVAGIPLILALGFRRAQAMKMTASACANGVGLHEKPTPATRMQAITNHSAISRGERREWLLMFRFSALIRADPLRAALPES